MSRPRETIPFPKSRRVIVDIGRVTARRPAIHGLAEVDVTDAMEMVRSSGLSFTAYVVGTFARAVAEHPFVHALRDWRGRLVIFEQVDVAVSVEVELEGRSFPLSHIVRSAESTSIAGITHQIRLVQESPIDSPSLQHVRAAKSFVALPGFIRRVLLRLLYRLPEWHQRIMGTTGVSSVGMFGQGGGFAIGLPVHPVDLLVGGIAEETRLIDRAPSKRRVLSLALSFDHDVVDGAPAARFAARFRDMLQSGEALSS